MSATGLILCAWCGRYFKWTPNGPDVPRKKYCGKTHKNAANKAAKRFRAHFQTGTCPTSDKRAYVTASDAQRWLDAFPDRHGGCRTYLCNCGAYHIGKVKRHVSAPVSGTQS